MPNSRQAVSALILTYNEACNIEKCLQALSWVDEIIVLDSGSEDDTVAIAKRYTDNVFVTEDFPGFGAQRKRALAKASHNWILVLDADEILDQRLTESVQNFLKNPKNIAGCYLKFKTFFLNKPVNFGYWNKPHLRLFNKNVGHFSDHQVHEAVQLNGPVITLSGKVYHYSYQSKAQADAKIQKYSTMAAKQKYAAGKRCSPLKPFLRVAWTFVRGYLLTGLWLDGATGWRVAVHSSKESYWRYKKLRMLQKGRDI